MVQDMEGENLIICVLAALKMRLWALLKREHASNKL